LKLILRLPSGTHARLCPYCYGKVTTFFSAPQAFLSPETTYGNFMPLMATYLLDDPATAPLARLTRRTFLPVEVSAIYASLGES